MAAGTLTRRSFGALSFATGAAAMAGPAMAQDRLSVAAGNYPLAYFAERIAGDLADVLFPVPADVDPSFWRPGIADISAFQAADLIVLNGAGFADWTARTSLPRSRIVNASAAFEDAFIATETVTHSHGDGGEHSHTGTASYVWLDFGQAAMQAATIAAALIRRAPAAEAQISENLAALIADLTALDAEAQAIGAAAEGLTFITSHPRYQYFGRAHDLTLRALDWDAREEPSEAQWQALEALVGESGATVFVWEAAPSDTALQRMEDLGLSNAVFAPMANRPTNGDFLQGMQDGLSALAEAVRIASSS